MRTTQTKALKRGRPKGKRGRRSVLKGHLKNAKVKKVKNSKVDKVKTPKGKCAPKTKAKPGKNKQTC